MPPVKEEILEGRIRQRWESRCRLETYKYIASHYLREVDLDGKRILDVGCGNGIMMAVHSLLRRPMRSIGLDDYRGAGAPVDDLAFLKGMLRDIGDPSAAVIVGDARDLPFPQGSFDVIYASQFLHHVYVNRSRLRDETEAASPGIFKALREAYRCLADDGVLVVVEAPRYTALRLARPLGILSEIDFETKQEPKDWISAMRKVGFRRFRVTYYTPFPLRFFSFLLSRPGFRFLLSAQYFILASKGG